MKKKVLIVGSGPSAYGSLMYMVNDKNLEITLIDNSELIKSDEDDLDTCIFNNKFTKGTRISDESHIFDIHEFENNSEIKSSKAFGGFSNVWGGTFSSLDDKSIEHYKNLNIDIEKYIQIVKNLVPVKKYKTKNYDGSNVKPTSSIINIYEKIKKRDISETSIEFSSIAINATTKRLIANNVECLNCGNPKWTCSIDSIWSTNQEIINLIDKLEIKYLENTKLLGLEERDGETICRLDNDGKETKLKFDKVFLGAGVLNTSLIMINSSFVKNVLIKISEMVSIPFISLNKPGKKVDSFSDLFLHHQINTYHFFSQFYVFSRSLLKFAENTLFFGKYIKYFPNFILNFFGGIFVYFDSDISNSVEISITDSRKINLKVIDTQNHKKIKTSLKKIIKFFKKSRIILLPFLKNEYFYGKSYHFGSQFSHALHPEGNKSDRLGRIKSLQNIHIIDASVLPYINAGSITPLIIANSYRISQEALS